MNATVTTIVGNVISDVKQRRISDGGRVVSFRVASNERRFDKSAEQWVDGDRLFVTVTCWRKLARGVGLSLVKGDPVIVTGRLYTRGYEVGGQRRSVTELEAVAVGPDLARCLAEVDRPRREATEDVGPQPAGGQVVDIEAREKDGPDKNVGDAATSRLVPFPSAESSETARSAEIAAAGSS